MSDIFFLSPNFLNFGINLIWTWPLSSFPPQKNQDKTRPRPVNFISEISCFIIIIDFFILVSMKTYNNIIIITQEHEKIRGRISPNSSLWLGPQHFKPNLKHTCLIWCLVILIFWQFKIIFHSNIFTFYSNLKKSLKNLE